MWGDGLDGPDGDHRPEVHDADGLQIEAGNGLWLWRALGRHNYPSIVQFQEAGLRGFGLLQRDRNKNHYLDDEANYHSRPGVWIEPKTGWGAGAVELLELPAPHEGIDNIAAWWVPDEPVNPQTPLDLSYRVSFCTGDRPNHRLSKATEFRVNRGTPGSIEFEVDFAGETLSTKTVDSPPTPRMTTVRGRLSSSECRRQADGTWTTTLAVQPTGEGPLELRVWLSDGETPLTETWAYVCPLQPPPISLPPWRLKEQEQKKAQ
jgi:glucans biosynthesis protein